MRDTKFRYGFKDKTTGIIRFEILDMNDLEDYGNICDFISRDEYTGLKDKNDKEIYEGDIFEPIGINGTFFYAVVRYGQSEFILQHIGGEQWSCHLYEKHMRNEIIGNIHENLELLESN